MAATLSAEPLAPVARARPRFMGRQIFASLQYRDFRLLWTSTLIASAGTWIQQVTLGWLLYEITNSAFLVGALQGARTIPFLLIGPFGGVLSDRLDRRKLLISSQLVLALLALVFALLVAFDWVQVWHFFAFSLLTGVCWAVNHPVRQALVANTVPRPALMNAVAMIMTAFNINRILGPAAGGLLIALFGATTNFFVQAVCFACVALVVLPMRVQNHEPTPAHHASTFSSLRDGLVYVARNPLTLGLILLTVIPSIFIMPFTTGLMPVFAKDVLGVGPDGLGVVLAAFGAGGLLGPILLVSWGNVPHKGLFVLGAGFVTGLSVMAFSQTTMLAAALPVLALVGAVQMVYHTVVNGVLQTITPDAFRGRVMSLYMMDHGLVPLGGIIAGAVAELYGSATAVLVGGATAAALVLVGAFGFKAVRRLA